MPDPTEPKPSEPEERVLSDVEEVFLRYIRLLALGIEPDQAVKLVDIPDIARAAERLYAGGCPPHLIAEILT